MVALWMLVAPAAAAENGHDAFRAFWFNLRRVVKLEEREGGRLPPVIDQLKVMRRQIVPMLVGDLKREMTGWLDQADEVVAEKHVGGWKTLKPVLAEVKKRRHAGTQSLMVARWMLLPEAKDLETWVPGLAWNPLMQEVQREVDEAEDLLVMMGWQIELRQQSTKDTPERAELWWRLKKPPGLEAAEEKLLRAVQAGRFEPIYRKRWLVVRMRARNERWLIERWEWLDR